MIFSLVTALVVACTTWLAGWWTVAVVALAAGYVLRHEGGRAWRVALGAAGGWALLLLVDAVGGHLGAVASAVAGAMQLPPAALLLVTLLFPALIGWSSALLAASLAQRNAPAHDH